MLHLSSHLFPKTIWWSTLSRNHPGIYVRNHPHSVPCGYIVEYHQALWHSDSPEPLPLLSSLFSWSSGVRAFSFSSSFSLAKSIVFCPLRFWVLSVHLPSVLSYGFDWALRAYCSMTIGWADMICGRWSKKEKDRDVTFIEH